MLEKSFGLLFFLKKQRNADNGQMYIYVRITVDGIAKELSVKRFWDPARWNARAKRALGNKEDAKELNHYLDVLQTKAYEIRKNLIDRGRVITAIAIINLLSGSEQRHRKLLALFKKHNDDMEEMISKGVAKGTWTTFNTSYKHTSFFLKSEYKADDVNILSLDLQFIRKLYHWYRTVKKLNHNSTLKNITNMKKIVLSCIDNGWLLQDPFVKFETTRDETETVYLTKEDLQAIANKALDNDRLCRVRDLFIFCCFTGLSFIDAKQLKRSEITIDAKGELRIYKGRQKTGTPAVIPLLPIAKKILKKYENDTACIAGDMLLPVLSNQKYNSYLKELAVICHVNKELSSKMARNTFGTTVTLANNVPIESISKMMGHKSLRQTQHYAKVLAIKVSEDMNLLKRRMSKEKFISDIQILHGGK
jgi:site-specific recombinase XerD